MNFKSENKKVLFIVLHRIKEISDISGYIDIIKKKITESEIYILTIFENREIFRNTDIIKRYFTYNSKTDNFYCLLKNIRKQNYFIIADLTSVFKTFIISLFSQAEYRINMITNKTDLFYNKTITEQ